MDPKKHKKVGALQALKRNNRGMETRVLIYILAAVVLVAAIGIAMGVIGGAGQMTNVGKLLALETMEGQTVDDTGAAQKGMEDSNQVIKDLKDKTKDALTK